MDLRKTLVDVSQIFRKEKIPHALIGGFALSFMGVHRATYDVDFLIDGSFQEKALVLLKAAGFNLDFQSKEVLQFSGIGYLDLLLANRPASLKMLENAIEHVSVPIFVLRAEDIIGLKIQAYSNDRSREYKDKADILEILKKNPALDLNKVKTYADLFNKWPEIEELWKKKN